jgi:hypothetical protein
MDELWAYIDRRTGRRVSVTVASRRLGNLQILEWRERQRRGGRPDISFELCQETALVPLRQLPPEVSHAR